MLAALITVSAAAQQLPTPSRTVYKCNIAGKVTYSDEPCKGAERLEVEPSRGVDSVSGRRVVGADVQREKHREAFAEALRPLSGMDAKQFETHRKRAPLSNEAKGECATLDRAIPATEKEELQATSGQRAEIQDRLFEFRKRFRELRC